MTALLNCILNLLYSCNEYIFPQTKNNLHQFCNHHWPCFLLFHSSAVSDQIEDQSFLPLIDVSRSLKLEEPLVPGNLNERDVDPQQYGIHTTHTTSLLHQEIHPVLEVSELINLQQL